jgi:protoporphyrin/coproporphyrin ferrochelatase
MSEPIGLLVMAYGTADGPADIERYYTDIRGGRAPSPSHLEDLKQRYAAIGNRFPLLDVTRRQAEGLAQALTEQGGDDYRAYLGMKHSPPFIPEGVARMREDRVRRAVAIVMAPHWSGMSVETYVGRVEAAVRDEGGPAFSFVRQWYGHPRFVDFLASRVSDALDRLSEHERAGVHVLFSAHSLPVRTLADASQRCLRCDSSSCRKRCAYHAQLQETADLVAGKLDLRSCGIAWQSAGRTPDPWWGPPIEDAIREAGRAGHPAVVVCSAGFVADHLEVLYDLDVEARGIAEGEGMRFVRTDMPNADPRFIVALAEVVRDHVSSTPPGEEGD